MALNIVSKIFESVLLVGFHAVSRSWWLALLGEVMDSNYSQDGDQSLTAL
jgi:hypothetical protein